MSIDVMKQALEALEEAANVLTWDGFGKAADALRAAIEHEEIHTSVFSNTHQQPVAWAVELPDGTRKPLYTHPARQPLTDEQLRAVIISGEYDSMEEFARAIETAHGIGSNK